MCCGCAVEKAERTDVGGNEDCSADELQAWRTTLDSQDPNQGCYGYRVNTTILSLSYLTAFTPTLLQK